MKELDRLLSFGLGFTVFFVLWGFIFSNTIIASYIVNDICYATLLFLFSVLIVRYSSIEISVLAAIWCPYLLYTIFGLLLGGNYTSAILWIVSLVLVCIGSRSDLISVFPAKMVYWSGLLATIGVIFQLLFPDFYYSRISSFFVNFDQIEEWENQYGIAGFTNNIGITAYLIVYGEIILLYMKDNICSYVDLYIVNGKTFYEFDIHFVTVDIVHIIHSSISKEDIHHKFNNNCVLFICHLFHFSFE